MILDYSVVLKIDQRLSIIGIFREISCIPSVMRIEKRIQFSITRPVKDVKFSYQLM